MHHKAPREELYLHGRKMAVKRDFVKGNEIHRLGMNRQVLLTSMGLVKATSSVAVTLQVDSETHARPMQIHHPKEVRQGE
jgi:hypothetical protein